MLKEIKNANQPPGEPFRRWFTDNQLDLIVWYSPEHTILGFQLCYHKGSDEHALTWLKDKGFSHNRIDDGEGQPARHKMTPILVPDGRFDKTDILTLFKKESLSIRSEITDIVIRAIEAYPG